MAREKNHVRKRMLAEIESQEDIDATQKPSSLLTARKRMLAEHQEPISKPRHLPKASMLDDHEGGTMQVDSDDEFRTNVTTLYLKNNLSAKDTCNVIRSAAKSGASGVDDMKNICKKTHRMQQGTSTRKS